MYQFEEINYKLINFTEYNDFKNKSIFTTREWLDFVKEDSNVEPLILRITDEIRFIGYFTSMVTHKFGVKIVGSPFSGWSTCWMGYDVVDGIDKMDIIQPTVDYLIKFQKVLFIQIIDRDFTVEVAQASKFHWRDINTLELQINHTDEELFKLFKTDCRNFIRQFERRGATLERVAPSDEFAIQYYEQLKDVFAKQGMVPTYSLKKVKYMMRHLHDGENILCLRVLDPNGKCIATSIFIGHNRKFFFWGGASCRSGQRYRPNEYMIWTAIRFWRDKGYDTFDMVGARDYKRKFGSYDVKYGSVEFAKYPLLLILKNWAGKLYFAVLKIQGQLAGKK